MKTKKCKICRKILDKYRNKSGYCQNHYNQNPKVKARKRAYYKAYYQRPEVKARQRTYQRAYNKTYYKKPEIKARHKAHMRAYNQRPEIKAKVKARQRTYDKTRYKERKKEFVKIPFQNGNQLRIEKIYADGEAQKIQEKVPELTLKIMKKMLNKE